MSVEPGDYLRVAARMSSPDAGDIVNVFNLACSGSGSISDTTARTAITTWLDGLYYQIQSFLDGDLSAVDVKVEKVEAVPNTPTPPNFKQVSTYLVGQGGWGWGGGTGTNNPVPEGVAACVTFPTQEPGIRARKFFGVLDRSALASDASLLSGAASAIGDWADDFFAGFSASTINFIPQLLSSKFGTWTALASWVVRSALAYQRRRKRSVGS
jgi:hypothetical protein